MESRPASPVQLLAPHICICGKSIVKTCQQGPLSDLYRNKHMSDVDIRLDDKTSFPAHSIVLSLWSPVFKNIFIRELSNGFVESKTREYRMDQYPAPSVLLMFKALYALPSYQQGTIQPSQAFELFTLCHTYEIHSIQTLCVAEVNKTLTEAGSSSKPVDWVVYLSIMRNVLNHWLIFYDESSSSQEVLDVLGDVITTVITSVSRNMELWIKWKVEHHMAKGLSHSAMQFLLTSEHIEVEEIHLMHFLLKWMYYRYGTITTDEKGNVTEFIPVEVQKEDAEKDLTLLDSIRWGKLSTESLAQLYNTLSEDRVENSALPDAFKDKTNRILLEALLHKQTDVNGGKMTISMKYPCAASSKRRKEPKVAPRKKIARVVHPQTL